MTGTNYNELLLKKVTQEYNELEKLPTHEAFNRAICDEKSGEIADIVAGKFFIAYAPVNSEKFKSLPKNLEKKYSEKLSKH